MRIHSRASAGILGVILGVMISGPAAAGQNPDAKLCMHLIAETGYLEDLYTTALADLVVGDIDRDLSLQDLAASGYCGHCIICVYDVEAISGVEFTIEGWPTGPGSPSPPPIQWEDPNHAVVFSDPGFPFGASGMVSWGFEGGGCDTTGTRVRLRPCPIDGAPVESCRIYPFAHFAFNWSFLPSFSPFTLTFCASTYGGKTEPHICVMECSAGLATDIVDVSSCSGCVFGGEWSAVEPCTWSSVKERYR